MPALEINGDCMIVDTELSVLGKYRKARWCVHHDKEYPHKEI